MVVQPLWAFILCMVMAFSGAILLGYFIWCILPSKNNKRRK
jgi:phage shock protein PspC (stress-responsive transcriptional regulator)